MGYLSRVFSNKIVRGVLVVASGTAGAQLITFLCTPFVTRMFGPEAYGQLGSFVAVLSIVGPIAAGCLPVALVLPKSDDEAYTILHVSLLLGAGVSFLVGVCLYFFKGVIVAAFGLQLIENYLGWLPYAMFFSVVMALAMQWTIRMRAFKIKAQVDIYQSVVINGLKLAGGFGAAGAGFLIAITTISGFTYGMSAFLRLKKIGGICLRSGWVEIKDIRYILTHYSDFWKYRAPQALLNSSSQSVPIIMLAKYYGAEAAGFYAISKLVLGMPSMLIGSSVSDVFYPSFVEKINAGDSGKLLLFKSCSYLLLLSLVPYGFIVLFGPGLFSLVFGPEWEGAGNYARWMALWLMAFLTVRPVVAAIPALRLQRFFLVFEVGAFVLRMGAIYIGFAYFNGGALFAIAVFSVASFFVYFLLAIFVISKS